MANWEKNRALTKTDVVPAEMPHLPTACLLLSPMLLLVESVAGSYHTTAGWLAVTPLFLPPYAPRWSSGNSRSSGPLDDHLRTHGEGCGEATRRPKAVLSKGAWRPDSPSPMPKGMASTMSANRGLPVTDDQLLITGRPPALVLVLAELAVRRRRRWWHRQTLSVQCTRLEPSQARVAPADFKTF